MEDEMLIAKITKIFIYVIFFCALSWILMYKNRRDKTSVISNWSIIFPMIAALIIGVMIILKIISIDPTKFFDFGEPTNHIINDKANANEEYGYRNWELYSNLRKDRLGKNINLDGGWRILDDSNKYIEFRGDKYYIFDDIKKKGDNYSSGTYSLLSLEINDERIKNAVEGVDGLIVQNNFYLIRFNQNKLIINKEDKSDSIVNNSFNQLWLLVDHDEEGIEAIVIDYDNINEENTYYFKLVD